MDNILEVTGLVKRYPSFTLDNISFSLPEGCVTGFIGANGAGKTTTIRSILNLAHKDVGVVKIFGLDADAHEQEIKDRIGIVMDSSYFYNDLSMKDMKSIVAPAYSKWSDADYRAYMEKFELDPKQKISTLSRGMRMKYALVLALSHQAELLIMDEPTSGLDPVSRDDLLDVLLALCDGGKSVLFSTHITSDLDKCAHNIIYIRGGRIIADAPTREFEDSYRIAVYRDGEGAEDEKYFLGKRRERDGFTALVSAADAPRLGRSCEKADLESIMVHLEKGV